MPCYTKKNVSPLGFPLAALPPTLPLGFGKSGVRHSAPPQDADGNCCHAGEFTRQQLHQRDNDERDAGEDIWRLHPWLSLSLGSSVGCR